MLQLNESLRKLGIISISVLMLLGVGVSTAHTKASANYMSYNERRAKHSHKVYVHKPIRLQKMDL